MADDDQDFRDSLERALRVEGYLVELACDGADALSRVAANAPDLVKLADDMGDRKAVLAQIKHPPSLRKGEDLFV